MPQEFNVLRCYCCETFQVHIVKKSNKWDCKICGEKQSIKKVYERGTGKDCRIYVQKVNERRIRESERKLREFYEPDEWDESFKEELTYKEKDALNLQAVDRGTSKWLEFLPPENVMSDEDDEDFSNYTFEKPNKRTISGKYQNSKEQKIKKPHLVNRQEKNIKMKEDIDDDCTTECSSKSSFSNIHTIDNEAAENNSNISDEDVFNDQLFSITMSDLKSDVTKPSKSSDYFTNDHLDNEICSDNSVTTEETPSEVIKCLTPNVKLSDDSKKKFSKWNYFLKNETQKNPEFENIKSSLNNMHDVKQSKSLNDSLVEGKKLNIFSISNGDDLDFSDI